MRKRGDGKCTFCVHALEKEKSACVDAANGCRIFGNYKITDSL